MAEVCLPLFLKSQLTNRLGFSFLSKCTLGKHENLAQLTFSIADTTLKAISALPEQYRPTPTSTPTPEGGKLKSPIRFADVWVGVSYSSPTFRSKLMSDIWM
jgi:hypothetical protein